MLTDEEKAIRYDLLQECQHDPPCGSCEACEIVTLRKEVAELTHIHPPLRNRLVRHARALLHSLARDADTGVSLGDDSAQAARRVCDTLDTLAMSAPDETPAPDKPLAEMLRDFVAAGGEIKICVDEGARDPNNILEPIKAALERALR